MKLSELSGIFADGNLELRAVRPMIEYAKAWMDLEKEKDDICQIKIKIHIPINSVEK